MRKGGSAYKAPAPQVDPLPRADVCMLSKPLHHVRPEDIRVGLSEYIPIKAGPHPPGLLHHGKKLVLVKVPGLLGIGPSVDARLLRHRTLLLIAVEVEIGIVRLGRLVELGKGVVYMVRAYLLLLSKR